MGADENYRRALEDAQAELRQLAYRTTKVRATIEALGMLLRESPKAEQTEIFSEVSEGAGISDAIRQIMRHKDTAFTPSAIKARLTEAGFNPEKYANFSAVVHNTLKRLETQGELISVTLASGEIAYARHPAESDRQFERELQDWAAAGVDRERAERARRASEPNDEARRAAAAALGLEMPRPPKPPGVK